ncbi:hypothetical protein P4568_13960, partial [Geobacillus thermodenitrificans]|nr:hypothetical protein [Geobacillus thermodenitrificans]
FYLKHTNGDYKKEELLKKALNNINPNKSHTYRKGKAKGWINTLTEVQKQLIQEKAGDLLVELGYEKDVRI